MADGVFWETPTPLTVLEGTNTKNEEFKVDQDTDTGKTEKS